MTQRDVLRRLADAAEAYLAFDGLDADTLLDGETDLALEEAANELREAIVEARSMIKYGES